MKNKKLTKSEKESCILILNILQGRSGKYVTSKYLQKKVGKNYFRAMMYLCNHWLLESDCLDKANEILDAIGKGGEAIEKVQNNMRYRLSERGEAVIVGLKVNI